MLSPHTLLLTLILPLIFSLVTPSSAMSLSRYTAPVPAAATVVETREQLNEVVRKNAHTVLHDQDGGYMLKDESGAVVAVAADSLCPELDRAFAEVEAKEAEMKLAGDSTEKAEEGEEQGDVHRRDLEKVQDADRPLRCSHPRCFNSALCLSYTDCHVCTRYNHCI
ncbi:hypothetical protein BO70DRAFT_365435 [Aspergillus heteromorphus CBS 117.55]|uniref:Uncharacterized protein n=1 Tax=Aspergillus heteromorphus CBS 117.55 TaxID=1448321 RepID=A0A317V7Y9_9EURO|nr:uncharacterized protein BO70DRAFT_365435 [Aspergillus heteromorphus CBS 117.55]PWY70494.1 hypothetical protein BO70DRAFT_365435 [Aspergillus heteromorphus CBS 117.55]